MQLRNDVFGRSGGSSPQSAAIRLAAEHGCPALSNSRLSAARCSGLLTVTGQPASSMISNGPRIENRNVVLRPAEPRPGWEPIVITPDRVAAGNDRNFLPGFAAATETGREQYLRAGSNGI